ncbi:MAG: hypothetical protein PHC68_18750 [Syntrophorhabdaceae bacterium]|nr:hypothetical protein [Syntrophorhabdaceae bacterium]
MITDQGIYFEHSREDDVFGEVVTGIHFYRNGTVTAIDNRRFNSAQHFSTVKGFSEARPVVMAEIFTWCRQHGKTFEELTEAEGNDIVQVTRACRVCKQALPLTAFPQKDLSFDGVHEDCCECRIEECKRIKAWCSATPREKCLKCPVALPKEERKG